MIQMSRSRKIIHGCIFYLEDSAITDRHILSMAQEEKMTKDPGLASHFDLLYGSNIIISAIY